MKLRWLQYNGVQCTAIVDIEFTDGTRLSSSSATDTAGVSINPKNRTCNTYGTGFWFYVEVNLSQFAGKRIKRWLFTYDNSVSNIKGNWRIYFDDPNLGF
ncbi:MAG: hypothetical protein DCC58_12330 [Chloroflexi bacterium]|nr:MAG: hypothetical protein DCC58_12330 [Chloroflexota bacterium]